MKRTAVANGARLPLALKAKSALPHEFTWVTDTLAETFTDELPKRLRGDIGYYIDHPAEELAEAGIEMIAPPRGIRRKPWT